MTGNTADRFTTIGFVFSAAAAATGAQDAPRAGASGGPAIGGRW